MKNIFRLSAASIVAIAMMSAGTGLDAQTRNSSETSRSTTTRSSSASSSSRNSSGTVSSSQRSSTQQRNSSGTATRSSSSSSRGGSSSSATVQRSSGSSSRSATQTRNTSSATQTRNSSAATQTRNSSSATQSRASSSSQTRNSSSATQNRNSSSATQTRNSSAATRNSSPDYGTNSQTRQSSSSRTAGSSSSRNSGTRVARPLNDSQRSSTRSSSNVSREQAYVGNATRNGLSSKVPSGATDVMKESRSDFMRIGEDRNVHRIPPRERPFMEYDRPCHFWGHDPHCYGYRVHHLPVGFRRVTYWGVEYCFHNGIYYRPYGNWYVVCRPPFGICIEEAVHDIIFHSVHFAYFNNTYRIYSAINSNNRIIDEQNRIIAQNNATIAAQNRAIALNSSRANDAYSLANRLGLAQSYAYADKDYFYQDGVFYIINSKGKYEVIVPPAGALVEELPDDYDVITLGGNDYYKVDDTVYRLTLVEGTPYLEVLGQMYGDLARQYDYNANGVSFNDIY
ncbi:MAG: hypothetical protein PUH35_08820 [Bacteroidales bacterium]|uniref:DUF6515 family protein n=1 Tax=Candidatus Cryptobacteroides sp. TaxID=2952915 RepID=UPI002A74BE81|nr:DUF6515 family protein [Candidatus Cryptobacteroides sp.]MDD7235562.1 hypothetical protein [Bacteroidales bacterium]MDY2702124.1 DUF6515 family protein [Candidatus Cryptobacteroides sp.]